MEYVKGFRVINLPHKEGKTLFVKNPSIILFSCWQIISFVELASTSLITSDSSIEAIDLFSRYNTEKIYQQTHQVIGYFRYAKINLKKIYLVKRYLVLPKSLKFEYLSNDEIMIKDIIE